MKKIAAITLFGLAGASFALQGGPTQPDYIEFEPSEMKDMVDLVSGNFAYSIPLGDVPSAYGNYPLSISYHAGISPQKEATWVGLGWTLSPGSIIRDLRGVPDDQFHGGTLGFIYQYYAVYDWRIDTGYSNGYFSVGVNASRLGGVGASAGVGFMVSGCVEIGFKVSSDEGFGPTVGVGFGPKTGKDGESSLFGLNASAMYSPRSGDWTIGAGGSINGEKIGASVGVQYTTGRGLSYKVGMSARSKNEGPRYNVASMSMRKNGTAASLGPVGISVANSSGKANSKSSSNGFNIVVPTNVGVFSLGFSQTLHEVRMRAATSDYVYGYMYQGGPAIMADGSNNIDEIPDAQTGYAEGSGRNSWQWSYKGRTMEALGDEKMQPAYDMFTIESEGVSGTFRAFTREEQQMFALASNRITHDYRERNDEDDEEDDEPEKLEYYSPILELDANRWPSSEDFEYVDESDLSNTAKVASEYKYYKVNSSLDAPFANYKTKFRNEANRLVYRDDKDSDEPLTSGINFLFIGEGGYYESEEYGKTKSYGVGEVTGKQLKRVFDDENNPTKKVEYALYGSRKIEPIFEDKDNPVSKLGGFVITNSDGAKYFFTKPVKSYLQVDYTINQEKGTPVFIDKKLSKNKDFWKHFGEAAATLFYPPKLLRGIKQAMTGVLDAKCGEDYSDENILYSYQVNLNPYATQWLLTEIQGPDYIQLDKEKNDISKTFGYNVRFHYTDPTLYQWRTPYAQPNTNWADLINFRVQRNGMTPEGCDTKMYQASFGVKEYVYLKSIETATHEVKFDLNDPVTEERVDGKGWYFNKLDIDKNKTLPIFTIASLAINVKSAKTETISKIDVKDLEEDGHTSYPLQNDDKTVPIKNWHEATFEYDALYINVELPELLQKELENNTALTLESDYLTKFIHIDEQNLILLNDHKFSFNVDKSAENMIEKTSGEETKNGLYKIKLKKGSGVKFYWQDNSTNHSLFNKASNGKVRLVLGQNGKAFVDNPAENKEDEYDLKQCSLAKSYRTISRPHDTPNVETYYKSCDEKNDLTPPLLDWADIVFADKNDDPAMNQMRYLKKISYYKKNDGKPYREYKFDYDYSLHPKALNSYCKSRYPLVPSDIQNSPLDAGLDICSVEDKTRHLYGKLTLKSITETGCQNGHCSSLPPFKFDYNVASQSSTRYSVKSSWKEYAERNTPQGQKNRDMVNISSSSGGSSSSERKFFSEDYWNTFTDVDASILASVNTIDEWGFWNIYANEYNHKVSMSFADYGAAAWSLNKITDPAGGVMEIKYERDEYKNGEDHANEHLRIPIFRVGRCGDFMEKDKYYYTPKEQTYNTAYDDKTCALFFPMYWHEQCLGPRTAFWDYKEPRNHKGGKYDYMDTLGIFKDKVINQAQTLFFKLNTELTTKIPCGFGGWFDCGRYRQVGLFGSTTILAKYDGVAQHVWNGDLPFEYLKEFFNGYVIEAKYVPVETRMLVFDEDYSMINVGIEKAADKIRDDLSWDTVYVTGNMWAKRGYKSIKGGDLRVKSLVRYDIDRTAKTEYEYEPGEMAQLPDSAYTSVMGNGFNTDQYSYALPDVNVSPKSRIIGIEDDDLLYVPGSIVMYPKVTIKNSDDKETISNGKMVFEYITPEKGIPAEYIDPETRQNLRPFIRMHVNFTTWGDDKIDQDFRARPSVLTFKFLKCNDELVGSPMNILLQPDRTTSFSFYDNDVKNVCKINVYYSDKLKKSLSLLQGFNETGHFTDFNDAMLTVSYIEGEWDVHPAWFRTQEQGYYPILYKEVNYSDADEVVLEEVTENGKTLPAQTSHPHFEKSIVYHDLTAFIGMNTKISSYRGNEDKSILLRVDSNVYSTRVPDVLEGIATGTDVSKKIGKQVERWNSKNELQCVDEDLNECKRLQWSVAAHKSKTKTLKDPNSGDNEKVHYYQNEVSFAYKRYPVFQTASITSTGFDNQEKQFDAKSSSSGTNSSSSVSSSSAKSSSSLCDNRCQQNNKRRYWSKIENHRYDPATSNPTAAVAKIKYADNGEELRKLTVKLPHHAVYENSSSSATKMARYMFKKNMLAQNYAEFVYSDSIPVNSSASWDNLERIKYLKSFNMKPMKKYSGNLTYTDDSQVESDKYPYIEWGTFTTTEMPKKMFSNQDSKRAAYRFVAKYQDIESSSSMNWPDKKQFSGNHILSIDKYFRPIEVEDVQGRILSSHHSEDGLYQTGIFFPASRDQTASMVPVGNKISSVNVINDVTNKFAIEKKVGEMVAQSTITLNSSSFNCSGELIVEYRVKKSGKKWQTEREKLSNLSLKLNKGDILNYLRVYPDNAEAKTYVYDKYGNIIQIVAEDNLSTYYEYNPLGQLIQARNDDGVSFKSHHREFTNDDRDEIPWTQNKSSSSSN